MTPEQLQLAAQGAARAYRARYVGLKDEWADLVQEALLALLSQRRALAKATNPQALAYTIAYRAISHSQQKRRNLEGVRWGTFQDSRTPEQIAAVREVMAAAQRVRQPKHVAALLNGESPASVARRTGTPTARLYTALWEYRRALGQQPEVQEWRT